MQSIRETNNNTNLNIKWRNREIQWEIKFHLATNFSSLSSINIIKCHANMCESWWLGETYGLCQTWVAWPHWLPSLDLLFPRILSRGSHCHLSRSSEMKINLSALNTIPLHCLLASPLVFLMSSVLLDRYISQGESPSLMRDGFLFSDKPTGWVLQRVLVQTSLSHAQKILFCCKIKVHVFLENRLIPMLA